MNYGMFWLLFAYAVVGLIWFLRGVNGYDNVWECEEDQVDFKSKYHKIINGIEYFWKPKKVGDTISIQEGEWVLYDDIDAGIRAHDPFYQELCNNMMYDVAEWRADRHEKQWVATFREDWKAEKVRTYTDPIHEAEEAENE